MSDSKGTVADSKAAYREFIQQGEAKEAQWLLVLANAKTPESMARAWIYAFDLLADDPVRALRLAIFSLRHADVSAMINLAMAFHKCDTKGFIAWPLQEKDPYESGTAMLVATQSLEVSRLVVGMNEITTILRWCFIQFVSSRVTDAYSGPKVRAALQVFYATIGDPLVGDYVLYWDQNIWFRHADWLRQPYGPSFDAKVGNCFYRAIARQPNWNVSGILRRMPVERWLKDPVTVHKRLVPTYLKYLTSIEGQREIADVYRLVEKCLFPAVFGSPPADFFDNYFLDQRAGNYIRFDRLNASTSPLTTRDIDMKDFKSPTVLSQSQQAVPSGSGSAAAASASASAPSSSASASAADATKKFGGGGGAGIVPWSPSRIPVLF
jgi:hypothetical protein